MADYTQNTLENWDCEEETRKALFLNELYSFYGRSDGLFTGLYQRFLRDLGDNARHKVTEGFCRVEDLFLVPDKID